MTCTIELDGGELSETSTPHRSGIKMKRKKKIGERSEPMQLAGGFGGSCKAPPPEKFFEEMNMVSCILMPYKYEYMADIKGKG